MDECARENLLKTADKCSACHKSALPKLNQKIFLSSMNWEIIEIVCVSSSILTSCAYSIE